MIRLRNESDFRNWFKKNYKKLGFSEIIESHSDKCPDFVMMEKGKKVNIELETKSSNFLKHHHPEDKIDKVICFIEDVKLNIPVIVIGKMRLMKFKEGESKYSFKNQILKLFKNNKIITTSEAAKFLKINNGTAERALLELTLDGKIERIKKEGVNLWILR